MSIARNIPIARKFQIAFGAVCMLCVALGADTCFTSRSIANMSSNVGANAFPAVVELNVIQAISHQTNRPALNAAIEAARAGEHGRGLR